MSVKATLSAALLTLALSATVSHAADIQPGETATLAIGGKVQHPLALTVQDLQKLPATSVPTAFVTSHGKEEATYTGVLLWTLLSNAGPVAGPGKGARLRHVVFVTGNDGYSVALALAEMDPDFEGKSVIVAYAMNGKPLNVERGFRLIVPNDRHGGRSVRGVVKIEVE